MNSERREQMQALRQELRTKTIDELQQLVADAGLSDKVPEARKDRKPIHIRLLMRKKRMELREAEAEAK